MSNFAIFRDFFRSIIYGQRKWGVLIRHIWPLLMHNIRGLEFLNGHHLNRLRRLISPTILTDLNLWSVDAGCLFPDPEMIGNDQKDAPAAQVLSKWLHMPSADGQPRVLFCCNYNGGVANVAEWVNKFKQAFLSAATAVSYDIDLQLSDPTQLQEFVLENERTREKLTLRKEPKSTIHAYLPDDCWEITRCPIVNAAENFEDFGDFSAIAFELSGDDCIGPLCHPTVAKLAKKRRRSRRLIQQRKKKGKK